MRPGLWEARSSQGNPYRDQLVSKVKPRESIPGGHWIFGFGRGKAVSLGEWKERTPSPPSPLPLYTAPGLLLSTTAWRCSPRRMIKSSGWMLWAFQTDYKESAFCRQTSSKTQRETRTGAGDFKLKPGWWQEPGLGWDVEGPARKGEGKPGAARKEGDFRGICFQLSISWQRHSRWKPC